VAGVPMTALLNSTARRPNVALVLANSALIDSGSLTSVGTTRLLAPVALPSCAVSSSLSLRRPARTTSKPSRISASDTALPTPVPAPVTNATFALLDTPRWPAIVGSSNVRGVSGSMAVGEPMLRRRDVLVGLLAAAAPLPALAQAKYPERPIRLVIPFPPGGVYDAIGRPWADRMKPLLGTVVVENQGGAGGSLGAATVARAQPDGYTLLLGGIGPLVINPIASSHVAY